MKSKLRKLEGTVREFEITLPSEKVNKILIATG